MPFMYSCRLCENTAERLWTRMPHAGQPRPVTWAEQHPQADLTRPAALTRVASAPVPLTTGAFLLRLCREVAMGRRRCCSFSYPLRPARYLLPLGALPATL